MTILVIGLFVAAVIIGYHEDEEAKRRAKTENAKYEAELDHEQRRWL